MTAERSRFLRSVVFHFLGVYMADDLPATVEAAIEESAKGPASMAADGISTTQHPLDAQMRAADRVAAQSAAKRNHMGIAFRTMEPGGCG